MVKKVDSNKARAKRHRRVRAKISGTPAYPRLNVFRSSKHIYAQIIDDVNGVTLASASTLDKDFEGATGNKEAARKVGALIVIENKIRLNDVIATGTRVDGLISQPLIENIFEPNTPLHDGAVIIRNNRIYAAGCFLPITNKGQYVDADLGSRHRAALGMSENSDALIIVVSEETGIISVAKAGQLTRFNNEYNPKEALINILRDEMPDEAKAKGKRRTKRPQAGAGAE